MTSRRQLLGPLATRLLTYPLTIGCSLLTAALLIQGASVDDYAGYTLVASVLPILAFLDLGYGGAATNWATEYANTPDAAARRLLQDRLWKALRAASVPTLLGLLVATFFSAWGAITEMRWLHIPVAVLSLTLVVYSLNIPFSIISKLLIGTGKTTLWIFIQAVQPLAALGFVAVAIWLKEYGLIPVAPAFSLLIMCLLGSYFGLRSVGIKMDQLKGVFRRPLSTENVFSAAWPMLIILIANPLALSSDRLILSWLGTTTDVASYSLGSQLFAPALALLSAAGLSLWPHFARSRFRGDGTRPWSMVWVFSAAAAVGSAILTFLSPIVVQIISGDKIQLPIVLLLCLAISFMVQSAQLPLGMYMMYGSGPKVQAALLLTMFSVKFVLSLTFIPTVGAGGPALATAIAIFTCQIVPGGYLIARRVA